MDLTPIENLQKKMGQHDKPFDKFVQTTNIMEELLEIHGVSDNKNRDLAESMTSMLMSIVTDVRDNTNVVLEEGLPENVSYKEPTEEDVLDGFCDINVFSVGAIMQLDYYPSIALQETVDEVMSRDGEIVRGKFEKYKDPESVKKWYKAHYAKAKAPSSLR